MSVQLDSTPVARLDFVGQGSSAPGWYVRYVVDGRPRSERLPIEVGADAFGAVDLAANRLGCRVDEIAVGGPVWPEPLAGMVDANETLEFIADLMPGLTDRQGEWRRLTASLHQNDKEPPAPHRESRGFQRRDVEGVSLFRPSQGVILNWSEDGMGIEIDGPLRISARYQFEATGERSRTEFFGEVRWCRIVDGVPLESPALYRAGICLIR